MTQFAPMLTPGYLARHAPSKTAQGREAALIDVAQDLLLRELAESGVSPSPLSSTMMNSAKAAELPAPPT